MLKHKIWFASSHHRTASKAGRFAHTVIQFTPGDTATTWLYTFVCSIALLYVISSSYKCCHASSLQDTARLQSRLHGASQLATTGVKSEHQQMFVILDIVLTNRIRARQARSARSDNFRTPLCAVCPCNSRSSVSGWRLGCSTHAPDYNCTVESNMLVCKTACGQHRWLISTRTCAAMHIMIS